MAVWTIAAVLKSSVYPNWPYKLVHLIDGILLRAVDLPLSGIDKHIGKNEKVTVVREKQMNLSDAIEEYLIEKKPELSVKTLRWYTKRLNDFEVYCTERDITELDQITASTVVRFVDALPSTNSYTRHGYGQVVKCFMNYFLHDEQAGIKERTVKNIKLVKQEIALKMDDLYLNKFDPFIIVHGKGKKSRSIPLSDTSLLHLKRYINRERKRDIREYVFLSRKNEPLGIRQLEQHIRHHFAVSQLAMGTNELILAKLMGHTSLEATKVYARSMSQAQIRKVTPSVLEQDMGKRRARA
jgi:site-specific recombinase XerD